MVALINPSGTVIDVPDQVADDYLAQGYTLPGSDPSPAGPDGSWTVRQLDEHAAEHGIEFPAGAKKAEKLEALLAHDS